jgi:hypothetical protein
MSDFYSAAGSLRALSEAGFIEHDDAAFRRAFNLFHLPHQQLSHAAAASVEWAFLEFTDHSAHRPTNWPNNVGDALDPTNTMTAGEYLDELRALLTQLIAESTKLAATLRYQSARAQLGTQLGTGPDEAGAS